VLLSLPKLIPGVDMASKDEYRAKVERLYFDAFAKQNLAAVDDIIHPSYTFHGSLPIGQDPKE
jgi:hypothetical protein